MSATNQRYRSEGPASRLVKLACGALLTLAAVAAAAAGPSPLVDPPTTERHGGKIVLVDLVTPDIGASKTFYGGLFGWTFRDVQAGAVRSVEASLDGNPVADIYSRAIRPGEQRQPAWLSFVSVASVDAAFQTALQKGGKSLSAPHDVQGRGRMAVFADPQGAVVGLLSSGTGDPPDELPTAGDWIWASLYTRDPDAAAGFYQGLFDYEVFDLPDPGSDPHLILASDGYARAAVNPLPADRAHAHWLNFVRVDDATRMVARVVTLGGKVLLSPRDDRHGGRIAIVADPQGAPFGMLEWPDDRTGKVSP